MLPQARYSDSKCQLTRGTPGNVKPLPCRLLAKDQPDERFRSLHNTFGAAESTSPRQERLGAGSDRGLSTRSSIEASRWRPRQPAMARSRDAKVSSTALILRCSGDTSGRNARCDLPLQIVEDVTDHPMRLHQAPHRAAGSGRCCSAAAVGSRQRCSGDPTPPRQRAPQEPHRR